MMGHNGKACAKHVSRCSFLFIISEEKMLRAVEDFDPKQMKYSERIELEYILKNQGSDSDKGYNAEDKVDPYEETIPFQREDQMKTIRLGNIG